MLPMRYGHEPFGVTMSINGGDLRKMVRVDEKLRRLSSTGQVTLANGVEAQATRISVSVRSAARI